MMDKNQLASKNAVSFEELRRINDHGAEYWSARDLQAVLGYVQWRGFTKAISKAVTSCEKSGNLPEHHFARARKVILVGKGARMEVDNYLLSRFACYLIAQNGDPRKPEIAHAQKYFAIQTRRQEVSDELAAERERLELRHQASVEFKALSGAARNAGVQGKMFGVFHDAGYKGLYGGLGTDAIKQKKRVPRDENLMDRMNSTELAANQFRMTQAREKLARQRIRGSHQAIQTHEQVGREVRDAIKRIGGTMPENITPAEHIKNVKARLKSTPPRLSLEGKDAAGLIGPGGPQLFDAPPAKDE